MDPTYAKLIRSPQEGTEFLMLHSEQVGKGGNATVYRAIDPKQPNQQMVVKVISIADQKKRAVIERELSIIEKLPAHPNIVRTWPIRCFSENNYYIFMEMCEGGTLGHELNRKYRTGITEKAVVDIVYQTVMGYDVLFKNRIVHLDIKPDNILVSRGHYKLADFGLAAIQDPALTVRRQGTKTYMSPERLLSASYVPNALSDVYSLGIVYFLALVGHHPYLSASAPHLPIKEFVTELLDTPCHLPRIKPRFSLEFDSLFELILRMIERNPLKRITFEKVLQFVSTSKLFEECRTRVEVEDKQEQGFQLDRRNLIITGVSDIKVEPLAKEIEVMVEAEVQKEKIEDASSKQIENYILSTRVVVCFLNRLARRLELQSIKRKDLSPLFRVRLCILQLLEKLLIDLIHEFKHCSLFGVARWERFRATEGTDLINLVERDFAYLRAELEDHLTQIEKLEPMIVSSIYLVFSSGLAECLQYTSELLKQYFVAESRVIQEAERADLVTLLYIERALQVTADLEGWLKDYRQLQEFDYQMETKKVSQLVSLILKQARLSGEMVDVVFLKQGEDEEEQEQQRKETALLYKS